MKAYGEVDVQFNLFLTSTLDGGEWLFYAPASLPPGKVCFEYRTQNKFEPLGKEKNFLVLLRFDSQTVQSIA
jgi:hypothetical protein